MGKRIYLIKKPAMAFILILILLLLLFVGMLAYYEVAPQKLLHIYYGKILGLAGNSLPNPIFHPDNAGIISALDITPKYDWNPTWKLETFKKALRPILIEIFGIHIEDRGKIQGLQPTEIKGKKDGITYKKYYFVGYDGLKVPVMQFLPMDFDANKKYAAIIIFSGSGSYNQINFEKDSYQHAAALELAKAGFLTFSMENRGMGELAYLATHGTPFEHIDAVARLTGGTWYGEVITDGLYLLDEVHNLDYVDKNKIGVAGISAGGALSMFTAAIDERISAVYVQGYYGSYKTTFGTRGLHGNVNRIPGILKVADLKDIAALIAPRDLLIVNGLQDSFYIDAEPEYGKLKEIYEYYGAGKHVDFRSPDTKHEFTVDIAIEFFNKVLKSN